MKYVILVFSTWKKPHKTIRERPFLLPLQMGYKSFVCAALAAERRANALLFDHRIRPLGYSFDLYVRVLGGRMGVLPANFILLHLSWCTYMYLFISQKDIMGERETCTVPLVHSGLQCAESLKGDASEWRRWIIRVRSKGAMVAPWANIFWSKLRWKVLNVIQSPWKQGQPGRQTWMWCPGTSSLVA